MTLRSRTPADGTEPGRTHAPPTHPDTHESPAWPGAITAIALAAGTLVVVPASPASAAPADRPTYLGKSLYTDEFHSHTGMSDGAETPDAAFDHVRDKTDADFFALTEHDVMWDVRDGDDFIRDWRDADSTSGVRCTRRRIH
ncbi:hypothetical protein [Spongiactinospora sp. TRM90649]|uniref:hypothetical protein n=1 Tax=Spongiactinospora sp. TRM90649 TaxID=3031114 RepID=UPI0023F97C4E|nr:hypothetical protein [Spongiactinospora sp. TRM90649]MDF5755714.1 hypothetical protein [Spongiactinospora sp. TRM90649]